MLRRKGSLPFLEPSQEVENEVEIAVLEGEAEISHFEKMVERMLS